MTMLEDPTPQDEAMERAAEVIRDEPAPKGGLLRQSLREARNWKELRGTPYGLGPIFTLSWASFFIAMSGEILIIGSVPILQDLNISISTIIGYLILAGTVNAIVYLGVAWWADRHSRSKLFAAGLVVGGSINGLAGGAQSGLSLGTPLVLGQSTMGLADSPTASLLADYYPPLTRGKAYAISGLFGNFGNALAPLFVGGLIELFGWRETYVITAAPLVILGLYAWFRLKEPIRGYMERRELGADEDAARTEDEPASFGEAWRTVWATRTLRRLFIAGIFTSAGIRVYGIAAFIIYLPAEYGLDPLELGGYIALASVLGVLGYYIGGGLVDSLLKRRPSQVLLVAGTFDLIGVIGLAVLPFHPPLWIWVVAEGIVLFGGALTGPAEGALYAQIVQPRMRTLGSAVRGLSSLPGRVFGAALLGVVVTNYGFEAGLWLGIPFVFIGGLIKLTAAPLFEPDMRSMFASTLAEDEWRKAKVEGRGKLLVCRDIDVEYEGGVQVLFGVDFDVDEGEIVALLGTNGAGKSTLLRAISGSQPAASGAVIFDGRDITYLPPHESARRGVIHMPGGRGVFPGLTVRENLLLGNWMVDDQDEVVRRLDEVFEIFPRLAERAEVQAETLSGGEQQQLSLAQAFLARPRLLLIDELSLGLAPTVVGQLIEVVKRIHERGVTIVIVEQSVNVALAIADRAIFMEKGEVKFVGATADLLERPDVLRAVYVKGAAGLTEGVPAAMRAREAELDASRPILEVEGIDKRYGGIAALDDVSLELREGEVLGLIGPNGSGKTTLFEIISGFQAPDAGAVRYDGLDITTMSPHERAQKGLVRRFQDAKLFPSLTVFETLLVSLDSKLEVRSSMLGAFSAPQVRSSERRARRRAERLIELLELGASRDKFVKELSTGLRRIVDLACVLATEPKVLLLDEPSSGIAQAEAEGLGPLLKRIRFETGCSILIIEHDMPLISSVADELVALEQGRVITRGLPSVVLEDERVIEAYLGTSDAAVNRSGSLA